jgi:SAM-dependent methyltransferase
VARIPLPIPMPKTPDFFGSARGRNAHDRRAALERSRDPASRDYHAFGFDYFDNPDLGIGYGGYHYDGRYAQSAADLTAYYQLPADARVLEIGCAKGFVLVEFALLGAQVCGLDTSAYAVAHAHEAVRARLLIGDAATLPFPDNAFDLVIAKEVLPHINQDALDRALAECGRVSRGALFFDIQCGETDDEQAALNAWDPTHRAVHSEKWWRDRVAAVVPQADIHFKRLFGSD